MSSQVCPTCQSALDPTHAPVARVRGSRVVTYCSAACADEASAAVSLPKEAAAVKAPASSAASAVPKAATKAATKTSKASAAKVAKAATEPATPAKPTKPALEEGDIVVSDDGPEPHKGTLRSSKLGGRMRKKVLVASSVIMLGGMAIAVIQSVSPSSPTRVEASSDGRVADAPVTSVDEPTKPVADEPAEQPAELDAATLRKAAIAELEALLETDSKRLQRLSGMALAGQKHQRAIEVLGELLDSEDSELSRIDIAYGLAVAGVQKGVDHLVRETEHTRRDVRIDASRRLVQLGNDAGRKALLAMLGVRSHRLGAAAELALMGDERGNEALKEALAAKDTSDENRMRAAVALGRAGDDSGVETLRQILEEGRFVVDAAGALAELGDEAAVPHLKKQLELTAMRVGAARGLARMKQEVDWAPLAAALASADPEGRVTAAEAILILTEGASTD